MDCKIYMMDGQAVIVNDINNARATTTPNGVVTVSLYNTEPESNTHPVAAFYNVMGYVIIGRKS